MWPISETITKELSSFVSRRQTRETITTKELSSFVSALCLCQGRLFVVWVYKDVLPSAMLAITGVKLGARCCTPPQEVLLQHHFLELEIESAIRLEATHHLFC